MKRIERTPELIEKIRIKYYEEEKSTIQIQKETGIHTEVIREILSNHLYGTRNRKEAGRLRAKHKIGFSVTQDKVKKMRKGFQKELKTGEMSKKLSVKKQGENNEQAKLNDQKVIEIRQEYPLWLNKGLGKREAQIMLGNKYGVSRSTISSIVRGATWKHLL